MLLGSHIGMSGSDMLLGSAKQAVAYEADTFMFYTGAPQNAKRKDINALHIDEAWEYLHAHGIKDIFVHAPYIINLGNSLKPETFSFGVDVLNSELARTIACKSHLLILHPGAHVGAGTDIGIQQVIHGLNEVLTADTSCLIALETMSGKGSKLGCTFEELAHIYDGVIHNEKLRICFDTCHVNDSGYDIVHDFDGVIRQFDHFIGKDQIAIFHINDSKNGIGASKDRHANIGFGEIGFEALSYIVHHNDFENIPKILETPFISSSTYEKKSYPPYLREMEMLRNNHFNPDIQKLILSDYESYFSLDIS